jgi:hypothetical protein
MQVTPRVRVARPGWRPAVLSWALWALAIPGGLGVVTWLDHLLRQAGREDLALLTPNQYGYVVTLVSAATVGAVLASRRPEHPVGWLLLVLGLSVVTSGVAQGYASYGLARPGSVPAADWAAIYDDASWAAWSSLIGFILLLTPTGSLPSPRWRRWALVTAAAPVVFLLAKSLRAGSLDAPYQSVTSPLGVPALAGLAAVVAALSVFTAQLAVVAGAASLVVRFRRARGVERQQLRWVAFAAGLSAVAVVVATIGALVAQPAVGDWSFGLYVALLPIATGAAVLRYRLYDLDRIISRTLAYGLLTVLLGGAYAGVVLGLGQLVGRSSPLLVAGATLAVASAFQPARRRVQDLVDRRFNRRRYDAAGTIEEFSIRLRQQIDLDGLTAELLAVVDQTMQPTRVSLWLRPVTPPRVVPAP